MLDALRGYVQLATGLAEVTVTKAREAASALLDQGVPQVADPDAAVDAAKVAATQVQGLADGLLEASAQNREMLVGLIRTEVDRAAGRLGFVREEELAAVRRHVSRLETQLGEVRDRMGSRSTAAAAEPAPAEPAPAEPAPAEPAPAEPAATGTPSAADDAASAGASADAPADAAPAGPTPGIPVKPRKKKIPVAPQEDA